MAADIAKGFTFVAGGTGYDAPALNGLVDNAVILPAFITAKPVATPAVTDSFIFYQASQTRLAKCTGTALVTGIVPANTAAGIASLRKLDTTATGAAAGNDSRFPTAITGIRKGNGASPDTLAAPHDYAFPELNISGTVIDVSLNPNRFKSVAANTTMSFSNFADGDDVVVNVFKSAGVTLAFTGVDLWRTTSGWSATPPAFVTGRQFCCFFKRGTTVYGFIV